MIEEHPRVFEARLLVSPPEVVFGQLRSRAFRHQSRPYRRLSDLEIEKSLLQRNDQLINLGLASYGLSDEVVASIYKASLGSASHELDARYKKGLRIACLSNKFVGDPFFPSLPWTVLGAAETVRLLTESEPDEVEALLSNENISDDLLIKVYCKESPFDGLSDERHRELVHATARNIRLAFRRDVLGGPDLGHRQIQKALYKLLETAPVTKRWFTTLRLLVAYLNPTNVKKTNEIGHIIKRWRKFELGKSSNQETGGLWTSLPEVEEFCCFLASLYYEQPKSRNAIEALVTGKKSAHEETPIEKQTTMLASPLADDIVLRCAYYASAKMTEREMEQGFARDRDVFVFSLILNKQVYWSPKMKTHFEEKYLMGNLRPRFNRINEQYIEQQKIFAAS